MGSRYKKALERAWEGKGLVDIKVSTVQLRSDKALSDVAMGKYMRKKRRSK